MSNNKEPASVVTLTHVRGEPGIAIDTNVSWQLVLNMMIDALVAVRIKENAERKKVIIEPKPGDIREIVGSS